jgi:hypothetical protein
MKSFKLQNPGSQEAPSLNNKNPARERRIGVWNLEFLWGLELGIWSLNLWT